MILQRRLDSLQDLINSIMKVKEKVKVKLRSSVQLFVTLWTVYETRLVVFNSVTPWTVAHQAPLSMEFSKQEYWSGLPFPFPEDLPDLGIEPRFPAL